MPGAFIVGRNNKALVVVLTIPPGLDRGGWVGKKRVLSNESPQYMPCRFPTWHVRVSACTPSTSGWCRARIGYGAFQNINSFNKCWFAHICIYDPTREHMSREASVKVAYSYAILALAPRHDSPVEFLPNPPARRNSLR